MTIPHTSTSEFTVGSTKFSTYSAQDAHGSKVKFFYVDGDRVDYTKFLQRLREELNPGQPHIRIAIGP